MEGRIDTTQVEAFRQFYEDVLKESPQIAEILQTNSRIHMAFNRAWECLHKGMYDRAYCYLSMIGLIAYQLKVEGMCEEEIIKIFCKDKENASK